MPIVIPNKTHPLSDGRQSENAMLVRRGVQRLFLEMGLATLPELPLASGRRADLIAVSRKSEIWIVEIKSSIEDWKADRKWPDYRAFCDRLFLQRIRACRAKSFRKIAGSFYRMVMARKFCAMRQNTSSQALHAKH